MSSEVDFLDDFGEGAFHADEENRKVNEETPEDLWEREFELLEEEAL